MPIHQRRWYPRTTRWSCQVALAGCAVALLLAMPVRAQDQQYPAQQTGDDGSGQTAQQDPPSQVARISVLAGNVSVEPASVSQFSAAEANYPLTTGDRLYADVGSNAELQTDQLAVRLGQQTDLTVTAMTDTLAQFGLASGSVHLRSFGLDPNATVELDTPNVAVTVLQAGDVRVDVDPTSDATVVWLVSGQVQIDGNGLQQVLEPGQRVRLSGSDPVGAQWLSAAAMDGLDRFSADRDGVYESSASSEQQYVDPETIGAEDLSANGSWETDPDEGPVWYPSGVAVGWQPYSCGRWAWVAPWGWTWVECESWGFAPFHYGRWEHRGPRWGWIPGPPGVRPYYSPALVAFVGGPGLMSGGIGVTAWFPLGPHEVYVPWYHASPLYLNRVNVANIYNRNTVQVRTIYNQRTEAGAYASAGEHGYVNRPIATVAVSQASFSAGKRIRPNEVHMSADDLAAAPVLPHPLVSPQRTMVVAAPARAVPARTERPTLASHEEGMRPVASGVPQRTTEPAVRPVEPNVRPVEPSVRATEPTIQRPVEPTPEHETAPNGRTSGEVTAHGETMQMPTAAPTPRPLFNKAVPPPARPSFDEQQKAIESTDPGRPLSPQQLDNLRENRPAGQQQQRETPHPPPAPRAAPPPAPRPPPADKKHLGWGGEGTPPSPAFTFGLSAA
jgi:hypothetical protein